jgi:hypothetical protein
MTAGDDDILDDLFHNADGDPTDVLSWDETWAFGFSPRQADAA